MGYFWLYSILERHLWLYITSLYCCAPEDLVYPIISSLQMPRNPIRCYQFHVNDGILMGPNTVIL